MGPHNLHTIRSRLRYLIESIEEIEKDPNRGRMLAMLLYWKVFDGIDIPDNTMKQLMQKGTHPESLGRIIRFALEDIRDEQRKARESDEDCKALYEGEN